MIQLPSLNSLSSSILYASEYEAAHVASQRGARIVLSEKAEGAVLIWTPADSRLCPKTSGISRRTKG